MPLSSPISFTADDRDNPIVDQIDLLNRLGTMCNRLQEEELMLFDDSLSKNKELLFELRYLLDQSCQLILNNFNDCEESLKSHRILNDNLFNVHNNVPESPTSLYEQCLGETKPHTYKYMKSIEPSGLHTPRNQILSNNFEDSLEVVPFDLNFGLKWDFDFNKMQLSKFNKKPSISG